MFKTAMVTTMMVFGLQASAATQPLVNLTVKSVVLATTQSITPMTLLNWNVGSTADYNLAGGFINGTMHSQVREATARGFWVQQDMDLGFLGAQKVEIHFDKETGEIIEILANGQPQEIPSTDDMEIADSRRERVTVPAGEFDSVWAKIHDKKKNEDSQVWMNPAIVPMGGMIKTIAPTPMGEMTVELTAYKL